MSQVHQLAFLILRCDEPSTFPPEPWPVPATDLALPLHLPRFLTGQLLQDSV